MKKIKSKVEYDELLEKIRECLKWYERRNFNDIVYNLVMDNGEKIRIVFSENNIAHLLGVDTEYLKTTGLFKSNSFDILKKICNDSYRLYNLVNQGHLTYDNFISDFALEKVVGFKAVCGIYDLYNIEFICKYEKQKSYDTGYQEQVGDYYISYHKENGLYIIGFKKNGMYYYPITNRYIDFDNDKDIEFLHSLLKKQQITMPRLYNLYYTSDGYSGTNKYVDYHKKAAMIRSLEEYSKKYGAEINITEGYRLINEKVIKILNSNSSLVPIYDKIFEKISKRVQINIKELESEFGIISDDTLSLIDSYNSSLCTDISAALDEHTKSVQEENAHLKNEKQKHLQELESLRRELFEAKSTIENLRQENSEYKTREEEAVSAMKRIYHL